MVWMPKRPFFLIILGWGLVSFSAPLSLKETVEYALSHSPAFSSAKVQRTLADLEVSDKRSAFLPSLDVDTSAGLSKQKASYAEEPWTSSLNLKLTENLYDNGKSFILLSKANLTREIAELTLLREREKLLLEISQTFYDYSNNQKLAEAKKDQLEIIQKQYLMIGNQYKGGLRTRRDFLRFKTEAQSAELESRRAANNVVKLRNGLRKLVGDNENTLDFAILNVEVLPEGKNIKPIEITETYDYRISQMTSRLSEYDVSVAKRNYWPNLFLRAGLSYGNNNFINSKVPFKETENYNANVGLELSFNLWDWGIRRREIERNEAAVQVAENSFRTQNLEIQESLRNLVLDIDVSRSNSELSRELLKAQEDAYNLIRRDYQDGAVTYPDLIDSLTKLLNAKTQFFQSRYQLASALAKHTYYEGKLHETLK